jgi:hypothetical protein
VLGSVLSRDAVSLFCPFYSIAIFFPPTTCYPPSLLVTNHHYIWLPKIRALAVLSIATRRLHCCDDAPPRISRSTALHCCNAKIEIQVVDHSGARDAVRCDANAGLPEHARHSADAQKSLKAIVATNASVEDAAQL